MQIQVQLGEGKRVSATFDGYTVHTDQPVEDGGSGSAPGPFDLFMASLATCAGYFVQSFCRTRGISTDGISVTQDAHWDEAAGLYTRIVLTVHLPASFPEKYRAAVVASVQGCSVKKHLMNPPQMDVVTQIG